MSSSRVKIGIVVGARPNFMKAAPILRAMKNGNFNPILIHTGQHYDFLMSDVFFRDLDMPSPDIYLGIGSMEREMQIEAIRIALEKEFPKINPDLVMVVGDVNSTIAAAEAAKNLGIKVAHVEAGLRSGDLSMAEEINRIETDKIADFLFTTEESANSNLKNEQVRGAIHFVGNTMIDSLVQNLEKIENSEILEKLNLIARKYTVLTLHRPSNVDNLDKLKMIFTAFAANRFLKIVFPVHPRTRHKMQELSSKTDIRTGIIDTEPLGYADFIKLVKNSKLVMTDSGGIQEETTYLGIPCLTIRNTTERPITVKIGTNTLVTEEDLIDDKKLQEKIMAGQHKRGRAPELWDGKAAERIVGVLAGVLAK